MELQEFKMAWQKQSAIGYSAEELDSIFSIKQSHSLAALKSGLTWDLVIAILISVGFIITLQILAFKTSNFWSASMAILAIQHIIFYQFQIFLLKKNSSFINNVSFSITLAIKRVRGLLWIYRLWPAALAIILYITYVTLYHPNVPPWLMLLTGTLLGIGVAVIANIISAVLVRKHLFKLESLKHELSMLRK